jgi:hypothetical protein
MSIAFEGRDKGSIVTPGLNIGGIRPTATFGGSRGEALIQILEDQVTYWGNSARRHLRGEPR